MTTDWEAVAARHDGVQRCERGHLYDEAPCPGCADDGFDRIYHVPRSQVWEGSGGRQSGHVHLHVARDRGPFVRGRIRRNPGQALCGRVGWYERRADANDLAEHGACPRCIKISNRPAKPGDSE